MCTRQATAIEPPARVSDDASRGTDAAASPAAPIPHGVRNHVLGVTSGGLAGLANAFLQPELILAGLVYALTRSPYSVAIVTIVSKAAVLGPQLWASSLIEHRPRKMPMFVLVIWIRAAGFVGMVLAMWWLSVEVSAWSLTAFFAAYAVTMVSAGAGHVTFMEMAGRMIHPRRIGSFFGARNVLGNLLAVVAGAAVIQPVLHGVPLPWNYLLLAAIGGALAITDMTVFTRCIEQDGPAAKRRTTLGESIRRGVGWMRRDHNYRMYFWVRMAFRLNYLGLAFFIPYGEEMLARSGPAGLAAIGGVMVAVLTFSRVVGSAIWGKVADRRSFRTCIVGAGVLFVIAPAMALAAPALPEVFGVRIPLTETLLDLPLAVYLAALMCVGLAVQAQIIGGNHFVVSTAPPRRRPSYIGFMNTVTSPLTLLPLAGAWLADAAGMRTLFAVIVLGGLTTFLFGARMHPPGGDDDNERMDEE